MSLKDWLKRVAFLLPLAMSALCVPAATAGEGSCGAGGCGAPGCGADPGCKHCPGPYIHWTPKVPHFKFKKVCGKPICDTCDMPGYGYYPTCWRPWDQPLNYFCPVPTPTQLVHPPAALVPYAETLPVPSRLPGPGDDLLPRQ